jgi:RHH-type proline utilization regulon transcriptional repressor/proline dehydrogenase/delta 1-pyrroline-5-carboxylate dehydrogenase
LKRVNEFLPQPEFSEADLARIEAATQEIGREILARTRARQPSVLERRWWDDRILSWAMQDESVKVQLFRFIDVLPMLRSSEAVTQHLQEYFHEVAEHLPRAVRVGLAVAGPRSLAGRALALAARRNALAHARRFIAGTTAAEVLAAAMRERKLRRAFTLDLLGEAVTSEPAADAYLAQYLALIEQMAPVANAWEEVPQIDRAELAPLPRVNVSIKLSALDPRFDPIDPVGTTRRVARRLRELLRVARRHRAHVHVDMEAYQSKDLTLAIFKQVLLEDEFRDLADVGIVIQCYLRDAEADLEQLCQWVRVRQTPVWIRLVKGAYWDYETVYAALMGWPVPVYQQKWESDACYERATRFVLRHRHLLRPALGSHNVRSLAHGLAVARHMGLSRSAVEVQMLYGMGDLEKQALAEMGYRVRVYMPYGELIPGMAYLVRRLLENTSNDSFLRAAVTDLPPQELLANPAQAHAVARSGAAFAAEAAAGTPAHSTRPPHQAAIKEPHLMEPFQNEPPADFARDQVRRAFVAALERVRSQLGRHWPLKIDGESIDTPQRLISFDPSHRQRVVGTAAAAEAEQAARAVAAAGQAQPAWQALGVAERARLIRGVAQLLRERRYELAAWQVFEVGKGWREADADVCEAIDFCEFYARDAVALMSGAGVEIPGEENRFEYLPRGVAAVIAPWNFPLAILTGMTVAALVTGNAVVMKPAEQSPVMAALLWQACIEAGIPPGVLHYLPGRGESAGAALVEHPQTAVIAFTGSREVGLAIHRRAAEVSAAGAPLVKRVIAEMGGKNAIIVDDDADLDEAVLGVVKSAFGYQGQKCSACSRAIVHQAVYDTFLTRLVEAAASLQLGPAEDPGSNLGPVIDDEALARIRRYIEIGRGEGRLVLAVDAGAWAEQGCFVGPHIFADVSPQARIAQEEIFGPVLAVLRAGSFDEALQIANGTEYALTGGVYSRSPAHLAQARRQFLVGNLYLNRPITGAIVGRQPFGGFKLSGIGSKAGGHDYLLQFVVPRTITENTLRRGFAPRPHTDSGG